MNPDYGQQGPGHLRFLKIPLYFSILCVCPANCGTGAVAAFSARRQDLPFAVPKTGRRDCLTGMRPILKSSFSAVFDRATRFSKNRSKANRSKGLPLEGLPLEGFVPFFLIAKRPMPPRSHR
jgi:hypothetical protein